MKIIFDKIKCFFGFHDWDYNYLHEDNMEYWNEFKKCKRCGKIADRESLSRNHFLGG